MNGKMVIIKYMKNIIKKNTFNKILNYILKKL